MSNLPALINPNGAPLPLDALTHEVISAQNAAIEERQTRALTMDKREFKQVAARCEQLESWLLKQGYRALREQFRRAKTEITAIVDLYFPGELPTSARCKEIGLKLLADDKSGLPEGWEHHLEAIYQWRDVNRAMAGMRAQVHEFTALRRRIDDHYLALEREDLERQIAENLISEAKWYEKAVMRTWGRLGYKDMGEDRRGRAFEILPKFASVEPSLDAIYMKIDATFETWRGSIESNIPDGVRVITGLLSPDTLDELTIACQRQVTGSYNRRDGASGAWVIVHRLQAADGLLNYVTYEDAMKHYPHELRSTLPICVGVGQNRKVEWLPLADFHHWLIGGYTGAGKSNMSNVLICTLATMHSPEEVRMVLIDLKGGLEFEAFAGIPHLHGPMRETVESGIEALEELESIMRERFKKFRGVARKIEDYHRARPNEYMPHIVCVVDEVAEFSDRGVQTNQSMKHLREIARLGRAVGLHLILCTQRPDVEAVAGNLKANIAVRISGAMASSADSVTILGNATARDIAPLPGRMVMQIGNLPKPIQTPHLPDSVMHDLIKRAKEFPVPPRLDVPDLQRIVSDHWTIDRVIELSLKHLNGNITFTQVYKAADGLTKSEAQHLVETIWKMGRVEYAGKFYLVKTGSSNTRKLVEEPSDEVPELKAG